MLIPVPVVNILALVVTLAILKYVTRRRGRVPPGPPGWPVIGNILDMPPSHQWRTFAQWSEQWGKSVLSILLSAHAVSCQATLSQCIYWESI